MAMIDLILETARRLGLEREPRGLTELHRSYLRDHPQTTVGRSQGSFDATLDFHCINMPSRFPKPREPRAPAAWMRRPLFKRVAPGQYMLLSDAELRWFQGAMRRDYPLIWRAEYDVPLAGSGPGTEPLAHRIHSGPPDRAMAMRPPAAPGTAQPSPAHSPTAEGGLDARIGAWLARHDDALSRFGVPLPLEKAAQEIGVGAKELRARLTDGATPPHHLWRHTYGGRQKRSKPYCLRLGGPDHLALDWEDSVVGTAEAAFARRGFETKRQLGEETHVGELIRRPSLDSLRPGANLRDLWALRVSGNDVDLWIVEAKGKQAGGFEHYCVAEALGQLFPVPAEPLSDLLGSRHGPGHGLCLTYSHQLLDGWRSAGRRPRITLGLLLPWWRPDVVWGDRIARAIPGSYFDRPQRALEEFLGGRDSRAKSGTPKERAFGSVLEQIEARCSLRELAAGARALRFRILLAGTNDDGEFQLTGLD